MTLTTVILDTAPTRGSVERVREVRELACIFEPHVNVALLTRALPPEVAAEVGVFVGTQAASIVTRLSCEPPSADWLASELPGLAALRADVARWIEVVSDLTGARAIGVRLTRTDTAMCPRFHVDFVGLRLVTTYQGPGTELLDSTDALREESPRPGGAPTLSVRSRAAIQTAGVGDVVLLKGEGWPGNEGRGAVHRSPFTTASHPRLLLTLDTLG
jgi:hypothetical protein